MSPERVVRRFIAASSTPILDKLVKDADKINAVAVTAMKGTGRIADQVEDLARENPEDAQIKALCAKSVDATYKLFEPFRPFLRGGRAELQATEGINVPVLREARNLLATLTGELDEAYRMGMEGSLKGGEAAVNAAHRLAVATSTVKIVFGQFVREYNR